jgi:protein-S-isoprenylcysteine O-methyltransferase Ste14
VSTVITRYALLFVIGAVVLLAATGNLFSSSAIVIATQVLALSIMLWARRSFPKQTFRVDATPSAETIIRRGPYRLIRHPMYSAALLFIWAEVSSLSIPRIRRLRSGDEGDRALRDLRTAALKVG